VKFDEIIKTQRLFWLIRGKCWGKLFTWKARIYRLFGGFRRRNSKSIEASFKEAVDSYLETCEKQGVDTEKPLKGSFNIRIGQARHIAAAVAAKEIGKNLNQFVSIAIDDAVQKYGWYEYRVLYKNKRCQILMALT